MNTWKGILHEGCLVSNVFRQKSRARTKDGYIDFKNNVYVEENDPMVVVSWSVTFEDDSNPLVTLLSKHGIVYFYLNDLVRFL